MKLKPADFFALIFILILCIPCASIAQSAKNKFVFSTAEVRITSTDDDSHNACVTEYSACTAVAFAKNRNKYLFFTAAHCVSRYDRELSKTVLKESVLQLNLEKPNGDKLSYKAKGLKTGEMEDFEDFAILEAEIDEDIPIMPLSKYSPELGEDILVVTSPSNSGMGLLQLKGYVSKEKIKNLSIKISDAFYMDTTDAFGIQVIGLGTGFGTSGGGVFSVKHDAIVGIVSGTDFNEHGHTTLMILPISKFNNFLKKYNESVRSLAKQKKIKSKKEK